MHRDRQLALHIIGIHAGHPAEVRLGPGMRAAHPAEVRHGPVWPMHVMQPPVKNGAGWKDAWIKLPGEWQGMTEGEWQ